MIIAPATFITRLKPGQEGLGADKDLALEASLRSFMNTLQQPLHVRKFNNKYRRSMSFVLELINSYLSGFVNYCPPTAGFGIWLNFHKPVLKERVESILP
ncbi:hypothetical protein [Desertivirga brevis]|uniref:hypothetical protein n=1 Tax=Desertivirga brevis TaxID=2810310 RepID=UPI001A978B96|nr:hypothetical protein [Pedobacter sp. SYSU D00873]